MEEITLSEENLLSKEVLNEIDNNDESKSDGILKYVLVSLVLLFKLFAFMHINQNNPSYQNNPSDNKSAVSEKVDTPTNGTVDTPANKKASERFHAFFYSHIGWGHVVIDVVIYLFLAFLFVIVSCKLIRSLWQKNS